MSLFKNQPGFCCVCGKPGLYEYDKKPAVCSEACWEEGLWRRTLCTMGKTYYPNPEKPHNGPWTPGDSAENVRGSGGTVRDMVEDQPQGAINSDGRASVGEDQAPGISAG